jgi:hypothetical protein
LTIAASSTAILVSIPLMQWVKQNIHGAAFFAAQPGRIVTTYQIFLGPAAVVLAGAVVLLCIGQFIAPRNSSEPNPAPGFEPHEIAAVLAFAAIPCFGFLVARLAGSPWIPRYNLTCVTGFACLLGVVFANKRDIAVGMLLVLVVLTLQDFSQFQKGLFLTEPATELQIHTRLALFQQRYRWIEAIQDKNLPVALLDDLDSLPTAFYAPSDQASRMFYVIWPEDEMIGGGYVSLGNLGVGSGNYSRLANFLAAHDSFLALGTSRSSDRVRDLIRRGAAVTLQDIFGDHFLLSVTFRKQ